MPLLESTFHPPWWLRGGHRQTLAGALLAPQPGGAWERERLELPDGDFLDLDWMARGRGRTVILCHGLEGSSRDPIGLACAAEAEKRGWNVLAWNYRGCSGEPNRLLRAYHSGDSADLALVIERAAARGDALALVGFSLGGNMILKYLGEGGVHACLKAGVAISAPVDLASSARALDQHPGNRIYLRRLIRRLSHKLEERSARFPGKVDLVRLKQVHGFADFDEYFTAPLHGFAGAADYWSQSSAKAYLRGLGIPTLLINALDDTFLAPACFPRKEAEANPFFHLEMPGHGGHLGFIDSLSRPHRWIPQRVMGFLEGAMETV